MPTQFAPVIARKLLKQRALVEPSGRVPQSRKPGDLKLARLEQLGEVERGSTEDRSAKPRADRTGPDPRPPVRHLIHQ